MEVDQDVSPLPLKSSRRVELGWLKARSPF